ncbi:hypothetical protein J3A83DRAFT_4367769 [Scleroderma citrinum]
MSTTPSTLSRPTPERHVFPLPITLGIRNGNSLDAEREEATLWCAALRYPVSVRQRNEGGLTLVLTHGMSSHKESYHPMISRLLQLNSAGNRDTTGIREIWSIDLPNHGESAVLNRTLLDSRKGRGMKEGWEGRFTTMDLSAYLNAFLSLPQLQGHRVVGVAHSGSSTIWIYAWTILERSHSHPFAIVFIEPTLMFPGMLPTDPRVIHGAANVRGALVKRDRWSNREEARQWLLGIKQDRTRKQGTRENATKCEEVKKRSNSNSKNKGKGIWSRWDDRALALYVEYAFEDIHEPAPSNNPVTFGSYTTPTFRKDEESMLYACLEHTVQPSQLAHLCKFLRPDTSKGFDDPGGVHIIWAEIEEFISKSARADILSAAENSIISQRIIQGTGHLIPQEKPDDLAIALYDVLETHIAFMASKSVRAAL